MGRRKGDPQPNNNLKGHNYTKFQKGMKFTPEQLKKRGESITKAYQQKRDILAHIRKFEDMTVTDIEDKIKDIQAGKKKGVTVSEYVALKHMTSLMKGDPKALESFMNRKYGTPKQTIEHSSDPEAPLAININLIKPIITPPEMIE